MQEEIFSCRAQQRLLKAVLAVNASNKSKKQMQEAD